MCNHSDKPNTLTNRSAISLGGLPFFFRFLYYIVLLFSLKTLLTQNHALSSCLNETIASYHPHYANYQWIKKAEDKKYEKYPFRSLVLVKEKFERYQKEVDRGDCSVNDVMSVFTSILYGKIKNENIRRDMHIDVWATYVHSLIKGTIYVSGRRVFRSSYYRYLLLLKENKMEKVTCQKKRDDPVYYSFSSSQDVFFQASLQGQPTSSSFLSNPKDTIMFEHSLRYCCLIFPEGSIRELKKDDSFIGFDHVYIQGVSPELMNGMMQKLRPDQWKGPLPSSLWAVEYKAFTDWAFFFFLRNTMDLRQDMHRWKMYKHATLTEQIGLFLFLLLLGYLFWAHCMLRLVFFLGSADLLHLGEDFFDHESGDEDINIYYILLCIGLVIIKMCTFYTNFPVRFPYYPIFRVVYCLNLLLWDFTGSSLIVNGILHINRAIDLKNKLYVFEYYTKSKIEVPHVFCLVLIFFFLFSSIKFAFIVIAIYGIGRKILKNENCRYDSQVTQLFRDGFSHRFVWLAIAYSMHDTFDRRVWYFAGVLYGLLGLLFPPLDLFYAQERKRIKQAMIRTSRYFSS